MACTSSRVVADVADVLDVLVMVNQDRYPCDVIQRSCIPNFTILASTMKIATARAMLDVVVRQRSTVKRALTMMELVELYTSTSIICMSITAYLCLHTFYRSTNDNSLSYDSDYIMYKVLCLLLLVMSLVASMFR
jgi:hypothetical protein